jgi:hypothetical protein
MARALTREKLGLSLSTKRQDEKVHYPCIPKVDLVNARKLARDAVTAVGEGRDPGVEKKATRRSSGTAPTTVEDLAGRFLQRYMAGDRTHLGLQAGPEGSRKAH